MGLSLRLVLAQDRSPWVASGPRAPVLMAFSPQAQQETQKAALRYERAVSMHNAAREMVFVAEQGVMADKNRLDPTWQEMLNHATCKVRRAVPAVPSASAVTLLSLLTSFLQLCCFRHNLFLLSALFGLQGFPHVFSYDLESLSRLFLTFASRCGTNLNSPPLLGALDSAHISLHLAVFRIIFLSLASAP